MKSYKTVLFICAILGCLALICVVFPKDGIKIGSVCFEWPSLQEVMAVDSAKSDAPSPEELIEQRKEALRKAQSGEFEEYCKTSPARFYMPDNNVAYLDEFFQALEDAKNHHVRIMHYADSQIEEDFMSSTLREHFQEDFGGGGVGLMAGVESVDMVTISHSTSPELPYYRIFYANESGHTRKYGPMGVVAELNGNVRNSFNCYYSKRYPHASTFSKVSLIMEGSGSASAYAGSKSVSLQLEKTEGNMKLFTATVPSSTSCSVNVNGNMKIYGYLLDTPTGVSVDNVPMRGCSGTIFTSIDRSSIEPYFKLQDVGLIILQYGGNNVEFCHNEAQVKSYADRIKQQIELFHEMAPKAKILFIGPADMSTSIHGVKQTYPIMEDFHKGLCEAANSAGAAYWNMYDAMGGSGSMVEWVKNGLAARDYIHFSRTGAEKISEVLYETFHLYYDYYRLRSGREITKKEEQQTDSTTITKE